MGDRCYSLVVCAGRDKGVFEKMGYTPDDSKPLAVDGTEIPSEIVISSPKTTGDSVTLNSACDFDNPVLPNGPGSCRATNF